VPAYEPIDIHTSIRKIGMQRHASTLWGKINDFNASIFKKSLKLYDEVCMVVEDDRVEYIETRVKDPYLDDLEEVFRRDF
jgi:hypothetical protein